MRTIANNYIHDNGIRYSVSGRNTIISTKDEAKIVERLKQVQQQPVNPSTKALNSKHKVSEIPSYDQLLEIIAKKDKQIDSLLARQEKIVKKLESILSN